MSFFGFMNLLSEIKRTKSIYNRTTEKNREYQSFGSIKGIASQPNHRVNKINETLYDGNYYNKDTLEELSELSYRKMCCLHDDLIYMRKRSLSCGNVEKVQMNKLQITSEGRKYLSCMHS